MSLLIVQWDVPLNGFRDFGMFLMPEVIDEQPDGTQTIVMRALYRRDILGLMAWRYIMIRRYGKTLVETFSSRYKEAYSRVWLQ